jgi:hypothetical protein
MANPEIIETNTRRYQHMLSDGIADESYRKTVEGMLAGAQTLLDNLHKKTP